MITEAQEKISLIDAFYGGIRNNLRSKIGGAALNVEELDIFSNRDFIQPEQIMSADTVPASTEVYAYCARINDTVYGYGKNTSNGKIRIVEKTNAGATAPDAWATTLSSTEATNLPDSRSPIEFHQTTESAATVNSIYYLTRATDTWKLYRYKNFSSEEIAGTLTGMANSFARPWMKRVFGELFVGHGQFICKVDKSGTFTEKAWTAPNGWDTIDMIQFSDVALVVCRPTNRLANYSAVFMWNLSSTTQFEDSGIIPMGGAQWIASCRDVVIVMTSINGSAKWWQLSATDPLRFQQIPELELSNMGVETSAQAISQPKSVSTKDGVLYFGVFKTDKSGIYAIGRIDDTKPFSMSLSKRFIPSTTSAYSGHKPTGLLVHGPNFYAAYDDASTASVSKCETNNSPSRSSDALYESIWIDRDAPFNDKDFSRGYLHTQPLGSGASIATSIATDYAASYTSLTREDGSSYNTVGAIFATLGSRSFTNIKAARVKLAFISSGSTAAKLIAIGMRFNLREIIY